MQRIGAGGPASAAVSAAAGDVTLAERRRSPSVSGFVVGVVTGAVFFAIGFATGEGPRVGRLTGHPWWVTLLEVMALAALVGGVVLSMRRHRTTVSAAPIFSFLAGWCAAVALSVAVAVFFDARSRLATFGLTPEGGEDPFAGIQAETTRKASTTLAVVNGFLAFIGTFAAAFVVLALAATVVRGVITTVIKVLRAVGVLPPETIADF